MVNLISHSQNLTLINIINLQSLQNLRLNEVPDTSLGHDGDGDGVFDLSDHDGVGHAGYAAVATDVGRDAFEGHHGAGASGLGDFGLEVGGGMGGIRGFEGLRNICSWFEGTHLLDIHDVHDDTSFKHGGEALRLWGVRGRLGLDGWGVDGGFIVRETKWYVISTPTTRLAFCGRGMMEEFGGGRGVAEGRGGVWGAGVRDTEDIEPPTTTNACSCGMCKPPLTTTARNERQVVHGFF